jgi:ribonuclease P protein component
MNLSVQHNFVSIKKNDDIKKILEKGKKIPTKYGLFFVDFNQNKQDVKFAVLIKKSVGIAVRRNYCKRIVREYIRNHVHSFGNYRNIIFLFTYKNKLDYKSLKEEFDQKLKKI